jgi:hypothetical protein
MGGIPTKITKKPFEILSLSLPLYGGNPDGYAIVSVSGLPQGINASLQGTEIFIIGQLNKAAANRTPVAFLWSDPTTWLAQLVHRSSGPDPNGVDYPVTITANDGNGCSVKANFAVHVDPLIADLHVMAGESCDIGVHGMNDHVLNLGPDPTDVAVNVQYVNVRQAGITMPPMIYGPGDTPGAPATVTANGWTAESVPVGGQTVMQPSITVPGAIAAITVTAASLYSIDPHPADNTTTLYTTGDWCHTKTARPSGPVCKEDTLLYVMTFGQKGASTADVTDTLDPCLDPSTVSALEPSDKCVLQGSAVVCHNLSFNGASPVHMVSFTVKPAASCAIGSIIRNQGIVSYDLDPAQTTDQTENRFCSCSDKSSTCGFSSAPSSQSPVPKPPTPGGTGGGGMIGGGGTAGPEPQPPNSSSSSSASSAPSYISCSPCAVQLQCQAASDCTREDIDTTEDPVAYALHTGRHKCFQPADAQRCESVCPKSSDPKCVNYSVIFQLKFPAGPPPAPAGAIVTPPAPPAGANAEPPPAPAGGNAAPPTAPAETAGAKCDACGQCGVGLFNFCTQSACESSGACSYVWWKFWDPCSKGPMCQ